MLHGTFLLILLELTAKPNSYVTTLDSWVLNFFIILILRNPIYCPAYCKRAACLRYHFGVSRISALNRHLFVHYLWWSNMLKNALYYLSIKSIKRINQKNASKEVLTPYISAPNCDMSITGFRFRFWFRKGAYVWRFTFMSQDDEYTASALQVLWFKASTTTVSLTTRSASCLSRHLIS